MRIMNKPRRIEKKEAFVIAEVIISRDYSIFGTSPHFPGFLKPGNIYMYFMCIPHMKDYAV